MPCISTLKSCVGNSKHIRSCLCLPSKCGVRKSKFTNIEITYNLNDYFSFVTAYHVYEGEVLRLPRVSRTDMGAYLCIASNGVPPTVSMRFVVNVQCKYKTRFISSSLNLFHNIQQSIKGRRANKSST